MRQRARPKRVPREQSGGLEDSERIRILADLFHNVPGMINDAEKGDGDYQSILDQLWQWNRSFGQPLAKRRTVVQPTRPFFVDFRFLDLAICVTPFAGKVARFHTSGLVAAWAIVKAFWWHDTRGLCGCVASGLGRNNDQRGATAASPAERQGSVAQHRATKPVVQRLERRRSRNGGRSHSIRGFLGDVWSLLRSGWSQSD